MIEKSLSALLAIGVVTLSVGCSEGTAPVAPSSLATVAVDSIPESTALTTSPYPTVMLQPDLTASPSSVTVPVGYKVRFVNNSGDYVMLQSYNCSSQFSTMGLGTGLAKHTGPFMVAGKTCRYFARQANWSEIFVGYVSVVD